MVHWGVGVRIHRRGAKHENWSGQETADAKEITQELHEGVGEAAQSSGVNDSLEAIKDTMRTSQVEDGADYTGGLAPEFRLEEC